MQLQTPDQPTRVNHQLIARSLSREVSSKLTPQEHTVLAMVDGFATHAGAVAWPCDFEQMRAMAKVAPSIDDDMIVSTIGRLVGFRVLDAAFTLNEGRIEIWVSRWMHRAQLRHTLVDQFIAPRANPRANPRADTSTSKTTSAA